MELNVEALRKAGAFTGGPVKRTVEWENDAGKQLKGDVWVRPMSYHTTVSDAKAVQSGGDVLAYKLVDSICHKDGSPMFRLQDITGYTDEGEPVMVKVEGKLQEQGPLCQSLTNALVSLVYEVSGLGKRKGN